MVRLVHEGSAASAAGIGCFDELLNINGERVTSAVHAVAMIRDAPTGTLYVRMRGCPVRLSRAAATLQRAWVRANRTRHGMVRASVIKPDQSARLGIAFSPAFERAAVVAAVSPEGIAASAVQVGDRILRVNGDKVGSPTAAARQLREALGGEIRLLVQLAWAVDGAALAASEAAEAEAEALAAAAEAEAEAAAAEAEAEAEAEGGGETAAEESSPDEEMGEEEEWDGEEPVQLRAGLQEIGAWGIPRPSEVIVNNSAPSSPRRGGTPRAQQARDTALLPPPPPSPPAALPPPTSAHIHLALSSLPVLPPYAAPSRLRAQVAR